MAGFQSLFILACLLLLQNFEKVSSQSPLKICARTSHFEECQHIERGDLVRCNKHFNSIDCMLNLSNGTNSFGRVTPDEAILGSRMLPNVQVLAEVRKSGFENWTAEYNVVLVTSGAYIKGIRELRNKRMCHPGYSSLDIPRYALTKIEEAMLEYSSIELCKKRGNTTLEDKLEALDAFLGSSCIPGTWSDDPITDDSLKKKYPRLHEYCNKTMDPLRDAFEETIDCLRSGGEFAITTDNSLKKNNYLNPLYICENGEVSKIKCNWYTRSWPLILGSRNHREPSIAFLQKLKGEARSAPSEGPYVSSIITPDKDDRIVIVDRDLKQYVQELSAAPVRPPCDKTLKWCVTSEEELEKLQWLAQASIAQGIYINIEPSIARSRLDCIDDIKNKRADVAAIPSSLGYAARKKHLIPLAFPETYEKDLTKAMVIVSGFTSYMSGFDALQGKKGCFSVFGDISFMSLMVKIKPADVCDYGKLANGFLGESCLPGVTDPRREATKATDLEKLCSICAPEEEAKTATTCTADKNNKFYGNIGALKCLKSEVGNFAVITNENITEFENDPAFKVLCKNGTLASYTGLKVDDDCYMSITTSSELVVRREYKHFNEAKEAFVTFEKVFGRDLKKPFELFNKFNKTPDLLFKDSTPGLTFDPKDQPYTLNYVETFEDYDACVERGNNGAIEVTMTLSLLISTLILMLAL